MAPEQETEVSHELDLTSIQPNKDSEAVHILASQNQTDQDTRQKPTLDSTVSIQLSHNMTTRGKAGIYNAAPGIALLNLHYLIIMCQQSLKALKMLYTIQDGCML